MFVHPKTGSMGATNITNASKSYLYKKTLECIKSDDLYELELDESQKEIRFIKLEEFSA